MDGREERESQRLFLQLVDRDGENGAAEAGDTGVKGER